MNGKHPLGSLYEYGCVKYGIGKANQPAELKNGALATALLRANGSGLPS